jgi:hypothetical protein
MDFLTHARSAPGSAALTLNRALCIVRTAASVRSASAGSAASAAATPPTRVLLLLDELLRGPTTALIEAIKACVTKFAWFDALLSSLMTIPITASGREATWIQLPSLSDASCHQLISKAVKLPPSKSLQLLIADTAGHPRWLEALWSTLSVSPLSHSLTLSSLPATFAHSPLAIAISHAVP